MQLEIPFEENIKARFIPFVDEVEEFNQTFG